MKYVGVTYKVTSVADRAFRNNKKVTNLTVGKNVTKIGKNAFSGCKNLKTLTIRSTKLTKKGLAGSSFKGISKKTMVKVPKNKLKAYKKLLQSKGLDKKVKVK